jgi:TonB family protein
MYSPNLNIEGVLELKRIYRRNMLIGFGIAAGFSLAVTVIIAFFLAQNAAAIPEIILEEDDNVIIDFVQPPRPPRPVGVEVETPRGEIKPNLENIVAVPDDEAPEVTEILSQNELQNLIPDSPEITDVTELGGIYNPEGDYGGILPEQGEFVAFDYMAEKIVDVIPVYPAIAARSGVECSLWINALVNQEGKTVDVKIIKSSNEGMGFEESAIDAAYKTSWKPAISNGHPVAIWVTYKVDFVMK